MDWIDFENEKICKNYNFRHPFVKKLVKFVEGIKY